MKDEQISWCTRECRICGTEYDMELYMCPSCEEEEDKREKRHKCGHSCDLHGCPYGMS